MEFFLGDRVRQPSGLPAQPDIGTVVEPGDSDHAVGVNWDDRSGQTRFHPAGQLTLVSRPSQQLVSIAHPVRRTAEQIIEGDVVEDDDGNRGSVALLLPEVGEIVVSWWHETSTHGGEGLRIVERQASHPCEVEPFASVVDPRPHRWRSVDVAGDDMTMWVHYRKNVYERLHHVESTETDETVFLGTVDDVDPRWKEAAQADPSTHVPEVARFTLAKPLGKRRCFEVFWHVAT